MREEMVKVLVFIFYILVVAGKASNALGATTPLGCTVNTLSTGLTVTFDGSKNCMQGTVGWSYPEWRKTLKVGVYM